ncbi:MAG: hypothetical protein KAU10_03230, partial [Dehalococcoidia bacterium]|nr:hypothetical protein [Dehalococcoidia bacterium]
MSNKWRVIGGLLVAAILIFGVVAVWATTTPNPTFDTTDIDYSGVTQISIKWERLPIIGAKSGTDAIHVTTSASTMDYAMVGV